MSSENSLDKSFFLDIVVEYLKARCDGVELREIYKEFVAGIVSWNKARRSRGFENQILPNCNF